MARKLLALLLALLVLSLTGTAAADPGKGKALGKDKVKVKEVTVMEEVYEGEEEEDPGEIVPVRGNGNAWGLLKVKGKEHKFTDTPPVIKDGRVLIPVRGLMASMGAQVDWDSVTKIVCVTLESDVIILKVDSLEASVNGEVYKLDVPAKNEQGRVVIPLRFIAEALGYNVGYDGDTGDVTIDDPDDDQDDDEDEEPDETDEDDTDEE